VQNVNTDLYRSYSGNENIALRASKFLASYVRMSWIAFPGHVRSPYYASSMCMPAPSERPDIHIHRCRKKRNMALHILPASSSAKACRSECATMHCITRRYRIGCTPIAANPSPRSQPLFPNLENRLRADQRYRDFPYHLANNQKRPCINQTPSRERMRISRYPPSYLACNGHIKLTDARLKPTSR
jgi:hypothetical protein